ncbi:MAG: four helix bundle protein [Candidatus Omnitrophica bacterium]|nr:four helix bundle protein [Candidatus Omnitrophota bacterium]
MIDKKQFSFEDLNVWKKAVEFAEVVIDVSENINTSRKHYRLIENLEAAATSVASNIAEGKGRYSKKEFIQFLYIARGSLYETITQLTIFQGKNWISEKQCNQVKGLAEEINKMLSSLIVSIRDSMN